MAAALRWYQARLAARPLLTQSITTSFLFGTGDMIAQKAIEGVPTHKHDYARTARMASYGGLIFGPAATLWFSFLQRRIVIPNRPNLEILTKVGLDQCVFASTNLFVFLNTMALLEGSDPRKKLESTYFSALGKNWLLWPPVQAVNFKFVPLDYRVLVVNVVALGWNCYLSFLNSGGGGKKDETELEQEAEELPRG